MAGTAEKTLDLQYYIWEADTTGRILAERLLQAADRGVRVRLLLDDIKEMFLRDRNVEALLGQVQDAVANGTTTPGAAARRLLEAFKRN